MRPSTKRVRARRIGAIDVASSALARVAPRSLHAGIDRARHDVRAVMDALSGVREPAVMTPSTPWIVPVPLAKIDPIEHALPRRLRRRWVTLRTDVAWLWRDARGERRPALIDRGPSRHRESATRGLGAAARPLRVIRIVRETEDAVSVVLGELDGRPLAFEAGQFLTFHFDAGGERIRRAYSLSTSPLDGPSAAVTVKRLEGGRGSALVHERLREGDLVSVLGPSGSFVAPIERTPAHLVMIAGGSGITPVISIAETVLRSRPELRVTLIYGNRAWDDVIFRERVERLCAEHPDRFAVDHVLSDPPEGSTHLRGVLDRAMLEARLDAIPSDGLPRVHYVCGPAPVMDAARALLAERGIFDVREERFHSPSEVRSAELPTEPIVARMKVHGRDHVVRVAPGQTLLEAGLAAGAALPFSCAMGGCGACRARLVSGRVHSDEPNCLSAAERAGGMVLTCSSRPLTPLALEVP